jgi:hypothetical protein
MIVIIRGSSSQNDYNLSPSQRHSLVSHKFKDGRASDALPNNTGHRILSTGNRQTVSTK